jgi:hypothetical protein
MVKDAWPKVGTGLQAKRVCEVCIGKNRVHKHGAAEVSFDEIRTQ